MKLKSADEFLDLYETYRKQGSSVPTKEELLLEIIKVYYDSNTRSDKKRSAKLLLKSKEKLQEYDLWKYIDDEELNRRLV
ncbi:hypothetical protein [Oceanobacillus sp. CF4.6]|uniref:hypothetical protein n=1 Tax=Oceanobacillus sp. CF4.6 TaxID=3373080 RepID=UPI003EE5E33C